MNKIVTIAKREYYTKVKKKSFIIVTILLPLLIIILMATPFFMSKVQTSVTNIAVLDESGLFKNNLENTSRYTITFLDGDLEMLKENFKNNYDALLYIPNFNLQYPGGVSLFAEKQVGITTVTQLERRIEYITERARFENEGIDKDLIERLRTNIRIESVILTQTGERLGNNAVASGFGGVMGFTIYFIVFGYGAMVFSSILEEKKNRIVEILLSSVRPLEIMIGKILGLAGVVVTQLFIWFVLGAIIFAFFTVGIAPFMSDTTHEQLEATMEMQANMPGQSHFVTQITDFMNEPGAIHLPSILLIFAFYFVFAYFFYATLYAALGAISDNEGEGNQFSLILTLPVILSMFIMVNVIEHPHGSLAFWASIVPFSSPIVMIARVPFNVPTWQLVLSMGVLVLSFIGSAWMSGKIYRTAIIMYGKKFTWKDLKKYITS